MITLQDLLFSLLNLSVVVMALIYGLKNYLVPQLKERILAEHTDFVELHEEHRRLSSEQESLEEAIIMQEARAKDLFKKVNQWRNKVEVAAQAELVADKQIREKIEERYAESARIYALHKTYHQVAPLVVKNLEYAFKKKFEDPHEGHAYLAQVLTKILVNNEK